MGAPRAAAGLEQVDRAALRAGRNMRFALGNAAAQIQDVVVSLQAGQQPLTVLIQQGSQLASAFGPVGVILGTVGALARRWRCGVDRSTEPLRRMPATLPIVRLKNTSSYTRSWRSSRAAPS